MNKEKQIEEMATIISNYIDGAITEADVDILAMQIYEAGYRKQSDNTIELPCKVGDKVWCISNYTKPKEFQITILTMSENHYSFVIEANKGVYKHYCDKDAVGKYVFLTKEEAERVVTDINVGSK